MALGIPGPAPSRSPLGGAVGIHTTEVVQTTPWGVRSSGAGQSSEGAPRPLALCRVGRAHSPCPGPRAAGLNRLRKQHKEKPFLESLFRLESFCLKEKEKQTIAFQKLTAFKCHVAAPERRCLLLTFTPFEDKPRVDSYVKKWPLF